eukprot:gene5827-8036_t
MNTSANEINIDQLQDQINKAEDYLRSRRPSLTKNDTSVRNSISNLSNSIQDSTSNQRSAGLEKNVAQNSSFLASDQFDAKNNYTQPIDEKFNVEIPSVKKSSPPNKYSDPIEREKLINRLLVEHSIKRSTKDNSKLLGNGSLFTAQFKSVLSPTHTDVMTSITNPASNMDSPVVTRRDSKDFLNNILSSTRSESQDSGSYSPTRADTLFFASDLPSHNDNDHPQSINNFNINSNFMGNSNYMLSGIASNSDYDTSNSFYPRNLMHNIESFNDTSINNTNITSSHSQLSQEHPKTIIKSNPIDNNLNSSQTSMKNDMLNNSTNNNNNNYNNNNNNNKSSFIEITSKPIEGGVFGKPPTIPSKPIDEVNNDDLISTSIKNSYSNTKPNNNNNNNKSKSFIRSRSTTPVRSSSITNRYLKTKQDLKEEADKTFREQHLFKPTIYTSSPSKISNHSRVINSNISNLNKTNQTLNETISSNATTINNNNNRTRSISPNNLRHPRATRSSLLNKSQSHSMQNNYSTASSPNKNDDFENSHSFVSPSKSRAIREAENRFNETHTFQPHFYTKGEDKMQLSTNRPSSAPPTNRLSSSMSSMDINKMNVKKIEDIEREIGLKSRERVPNTSSPNQNIPAKTVTIAEVNLKLKEQSRIHEAKRREREKQKRELDALAMVDCTFKPKLSKGSEMIMNRKARSVEITPFYENYSFDDDEPRRGRSRSKSIDRNNEYDSSLERTYPTRTYSRSYSYSPNREKESIPQNSRRSNSITRRSMSPSVSASNRLYKEANIRANQQRWLEQQINNIRQSQYSFHPQINPVSSMILAASTNGKESEYKPIYERVEEVQRNRRKYMTELKQTIEELQSKEMTFNPKINRKSKVIAENKFKSSSYDENDKDEEEEKENNEKYYNRKQQQKELFYSGVAEAKAVIGFHTKVESRLLDQGKLMTRRKQALMQERDQAIAEAMEGPTLSVGSKLIAQSSATVSAPFNERQKLYKEKVFRKEQLRRKAEAERVGEWFHPEIGNSRAILAQNRPKLLEESEKERIDRLHRLDRETIEERRKIRENELYGDLRFSPHIDPLSKVLGRNSSIQELNENQRGKQRKALLIQQIEEQQNQSCTFVPKINDISKQLLEPYKDDIDYNQQFRPIGWSEQQQADVNRHMTPTDIYNIHRNRINFNQPEKMSKEIRLHLLEKEEKRRNALIDKEMNELKNCTFQPRLNQSTSTANIEPVVVRGINRHLELRNLTAKIKHNAMEREKEVFSVKSVDKYRRPEDGSTVVQTFNFSLQTPKHHSRVQESDSNEQVNPYQYLYVPTKDRSYAVDNYYENNRSVHNSSIQHPAD